MRYTPWWFPRRSTAGAHPFLVGLQLPPYPAKLVAKIRSVKFVELKELLPDNVAASEQNAGIARPQNHLPKQREVTSILTWISAFLTYTAILAEAFPARTKELMAYSRLIVRGASRGSGKGWLSYDRIFRQNAAANQSLSWTNLDQSLHSSFCLGSEPPPMVCSLCNELDHWVEDCALSRNAPSMAPPPAHPKDLSGQNPGRAPSVRKLTCTCLSWNISSKCMQPGTCEFLHECHEDHIAKDCSLTLADIRCVATPTTWLQCMPSTSAQ